MLLVLVEFSSMECQVHRMYLVLFILLSGSFQVNKFKKKKRFFFHDFEMDVYDFWSHRELDILLYPVTQS